MLQGTAVAGAILHNVTLASTPGRHGLYAEDLIGAVNGEVKNPKGIRGMPWTPGQAKAKTKKATTAKKKRKWSKVANKVLERTGDEGKAIRIANAAVKRKGKFAHRRKT